MFFEDSQKSIKLMNIYGFCQKNVTNENVLNYSSISFRKKDSVAEFVSCGKSYKLTEGVIAYIPEGIKYTRKSMTDDVITINFKTDSTDDEIELFQPSNTEKYAEKFIKAYEIWNSRKIGMYAECGAILFDIIADVCKDKEKEDNIPYIMKKILNQIHNEFANPTLTVEKLARDNYICEVYLRKLFCRYLSVSPKKYITALRMDKALSLFETGELAIKEIAAQCGYQNTAYFYDVFKKYRLLHIDKY